jgi:hypothetical protein
MQRAPRTLTRSRTRVGSSAVLGALLVAFAAHGCGKASYTADDVRASLRPYVHVVGDEGLVPVGPVRDGVQTFVLPLTSLSERVPRPRVGPLGVEVVLTAGVAALGLHEIRARMVEHAPDERVLATPEGLGLFGTAVLPTQTSPPRALASLARQDGATLAPGRFEVELATGPEASTPWRLVLGAGEWGNGGGARTAAVVIDGIAHELALGPNDALAVPARARHSVESSVPLDHLALREARPLGEAQPLVLHTYVRRITGVALERLGGIGAVHPLLELDWRQMTPQEVSAASDAATDSGLLRPGWALFSYFRLPRELPAGRVATILLDIDVRHGGLREELDDTLVRADEGWLRDVARGPHILGGEDLLVHFEGPDGQLDIRPTMGPGAAWGDYDGDGWQDLYLVQGGGRSGSAPNANRLLRNRGGSGTPQKGDGPWFEDVTERAGVGDTGAGMGALFVDLDGDGDLDLYVANYGLDVLYLNQGNGTFADASDLLPGHDLWSAGVAAADTDGDGDLDLYVTSYLEYDLTKTPPAEELGRYDREDPLEMLPFAFPGQRNVFLRNEGVAADGRPRFVDVTEALGLLDVQGRGMQPVFWDFDRDGDQDLYVANDVSYNVLFRNEGDGTFKDVSFATGLDDPRGGMGLAAADVDNDGDEDMFLTNWQLEANALYINSHTSPFETRTRRAAFHDASVRAGLARASVGVTGWGVALFDLELDGDLDVLVANGYTSPDYVGTGICVGQPNHLFVNDGAGRFGDGAALASDALNVLLASRGVAPCDFDRDGDVDLCVTANNGPVQLLENHAPRRGSWLLVTLRQPGPNPFAIGAEVTVHTSGGRQFRRALRAGEGYLTGNPAELHFGLGEVGEIERIEVRWPDGTLTEHRDVAVDRTHSLRRP